MEQERNYIGLKIKKIRKVNALTQEKFCERIGIEPSSLSNIETGKSFPSMGTVLTIMKEFNIPPENFFNFATFSTEEELEDMILSIIKSLSYENKQLIFKILKQFVV